MSPAAAGAAVAEKKPKSKKTADRHKGRVQIAIKPSLDELLQTLATRNTRPKRWEVHIAIVEHLRRQGIEVPPEIADNP